MKQLQKTIFPLILALILVLSTGMTVLAAGEGNIDGGGGGMGSGTSSKASIEAIRRYFCSEYTAQLVASKAGIAFEELVSGSYKLVIEPIAYFTHGGRNYAMTATEAALYNQMSGGTLRSKLPSLTHQNLPLSIFLETPDQQPGGQP